MLAGKRPASILELLQVLENSDIPAGSVNVLTTSDPEALTQVLASHEDVDAMWYFGIDGGSGVVEHLSVSNMKRTWVNYGKPFNWVGAQGESPEFCRQATQVKNVWDPISNPA